jgi:hypothetical protein
MNKIYIVVIFFAACGQNNYLFLHANDSQTQKIVVDIAKDFNENIGCEAWSTSSHIVNIDNETIDRRSVSITRSTKETQAYGADSWGACDFFTSDIFYTEELDFETWTNGIKFVLLHELGHAMGLDHEENTVMQPMLFDKVDDKTVSKMLPYKEALESLAYLLNKHHKNPCETF